jgi:hypothetical protein
MNVCDYQYVKLRLLIAFARETESQADLAMLLQLDIYRKHMF